MPPFLSRCSHYRCAARPNCLSRRESHARGFVQYVVCCLPRFRLWALVESSSRSIVIVLDALWSIFYPSACILRYTKGNLDLLVNFIDSLFWIFATTIFWVRCNNSKSIHDFRVPLCRGLALVLLIIRGRGKVVEIFPLTSSTSTFFCPWQLLTLA
jgi:hypothetical protein